MGHGPFRDLHEASLYTNKPSTTLQEYHYRRCDSLQNGDNKINGFDRGAVVVHVCSSEFVKIPITDQIDPAELQGENRKWPILMNGTNAQTGSEIDHRGIVATKGDRIEDRRATTRVDRTGILESISTSIFRDKSRDGSSVLVTGQFEKNLVNTVRTYTNRVCGGSQEETLVIVSYVNVDTVLIRTTSGVEKDHEIGTPLVRSPIISLGTGNLRDELAPVIRPIWNAIGHGRSDHVTEGEWEFDS